MTDEQINEKIAEACGWHDFKLSTLFSGSRLTACIPGDSQRLFVPDYCNDLNACHEFAAWLDTEQQIQFAEELWFLVSENPYRVWWNLNANEAYQLAEATARQRAEAFLRTLNLWEE